MKLTLRPPSLIFSVWISLGVAVITGITLVVWLFKGPIITVINEKTPLTSVLTGLPCRTPEKRPIAVMLASDAQARPLTGLAEADMVFEMPVTPGGITRLMAVYQCGPDPLEIGSIRSARQDFIPLAQGLNAIYAHWGGEHEALAQLNDGIVDNIDALIYENTVFYRKPRVPRPHNGFTTLERILIQAEKLHYNTTAKISGYPHLSKALRPRNLSNTANRVTIDWPSGMNVEYRYDSANNTYARWRGSAPEIDAGTGRQITASVVIVMNTESSFVRDQYISVRVLGRGSATIYQNGQQILATWKKNSPSDMLVFNDADGNPIPFAPGPIWVEIDAAPSTIIQ